MLQLPQLGTPEDPGTHQQAYVRHESQEEWQVHVQQLGVRVCRRRNVAIMTIRILMMMIMMIIMVVVKVMVLAMFMMVILTLTKGDW